MSFKRSFTSEPPGSDRRSGLNRRWIKSAYQGVERRSGKDRRLELLGAEGAAPPPDADRIERLEKLLLSTTLRLEAVARLLVDKRILTHEELREMLQSLHDAYQERRLEADT
ncbi:MAG: hypothetical protein MUD16_02875 [Desulfobacterales bacterium]|jgi:hypothetical protein|nr:hypothetical protein [Desulfobacterales bacterium]